MQKQTGKTKLPIFPLFPRAVVSNMTENSSQLPLEHEFLIRSRVKEPFLKLKYINRLIYTTSTAKNRQTSRGKITVM